MILQVKDLTKEFGGLVAVDSLSFHVNEHDILGVIGPNGAGKSTVLNLIKGFIQPTSGNIFFNDHNITGLPDYRIAQEGIGCNFQTSSLFMDLSVIENVFIAYHLQYKVPILKRILRLPSAREEESILKQKGMKLLEKMGLGHISNEITKNLPFGYQRILGVCMALAISPSLLLLDEPITGMNQNEINFMLSKIQNIRDSGITIILVEHNMEAIMRLCERILVLNFGKKIAEGTPQEIKNNESVIEAYLGKE